jgi:hypothetical protein
MERRTDYRMALRIETVLHAAAATGMVEAARKLAEFGVSVDVSVRVLTRPEARRQTTAARMLADDTPPA